MLRDSRGIMSVLVVLGLLFPFGDTAAVQQKIRLDVPGIT